MATYTSIQVSAFSGKNGGTTTVAPFLAVGTQNSIPFPGYAFIAKYKNQGWYSGSPETPWISFGAPSTTPPSGHTLTNLQHEVLEPQP